VNVLTSLANAASALEKAGQSFALVGGLAVGIRSEPRFTRDADLAVAVESDAEAEAIVHGFLSSGFRVLTTLEQEVTGRLATVRLLAPGESEGRFVIDLLFASSGIEPEIVAGATVEGLEPGLSLPVASAAHLVAMKVLSENDSRFQDRADLIALLADAPPEVIRTAREALDLITQRGTHRGKDLQATLDHFVALAARATDTEFGFRTK
jgi:hypothetical protein